MALPVGPKAEKSCQSSGSISRDAHGNFSASAAWFWMRGAILIRNFSNNRSSETPARVIRFEIIDALNSWNLVLLICGLDCTICGLSFAEVDQKYGRFQRIASVLTNTDNSKTLPIGLSEFATMFTVDWGSTMAAAFLMTVPVVAVFLVFQKQFVRGLSAGAVKG
jgi:hypothetical protein